MNDNLADLIVDWLESQREAYRTAAQTAGIPSTVQLRAAVATKIGDTEMTIEYVGRRVSPLAVRDLAWAIGRIVEDTNSSPASPAPLAEELFGDGTTCWSPLIANNTRELIEQLMQATSREYLAALESLDTPSPELAAEMSRELVELFEADTVTLATVIPLGGITLPNDPIEVHHLRLRALSADEVGHLFEAGNTEVGQIAPRRSIRRVVIAPASERCALEVRTSGDKREQPIDRLVPHKTVLALQLLGFELQGSGTSTAWTEPGPTLHVGFPTISLAATGSTKPCPAETLERASTLAAAIPDGAIWNPATRQELVLHRFKLGVVENSAIDALVDYVIALESFLLGEKEGEYRFKFGLFGGWYLEHEPAAREAVAKSLRDIYDTRSQIVHGSVPSPAQVAETVSAARELTARMIIKALESAWPSQDELRRAAYG